MYILNVSYESVFIKFILTLPKMNNMSILTSQAHNYDHIHTEPAVLLQS